MKVVSYKCCKKGEEDKGEEDLRADLVNFPGFLIKSRVFFAGAVIPFPVETYPMEKCLN